MGFSRSEEVFDEHANTILSGSRGGFVYVLSSIQACCEQRIIEGSKGSSETNLLYQ